MNCPEIKEELSAYIDGELSEDLARTVQEHISGCPGCRADLESLQAVRRDFASMPATRVSSDFGRKIHATMDPTTRGPALPWRRVLVPLAFAASVVIVIVALNREPAREQPSISAVDISDQMRSMDLSGYHSGIHENASAEDIPGLTTRVPCLSPGETTSEASQPKT